MNRIQKGSTHLPQKKKESGEEKKKEKKFGQASCLAQLLII
jgi:hypothetical protein